MAGEKNNGKRLAAPPLKGRCALIRHEHIINGTYKPWTVKRLNRLTRLLNCSVEELCEYAAIFNYQKMYTWIKRDNIPPYVGLHFASLERAYGEVMFKRKADTPMPVAALLGVET